MVTVAIFTMIFGAVHFVIVQQDRTELGQDTPGEVLSSSISTSDQNENQTRPRYASCGHNPIEARARGCNFDISSFAWLTPECYDDRLTQDFIAWSNWTWYTSDNSSDHTQIPFETAILGQQDTFVNWDYHMVHCTFMWRLQHSSMESGWIGRHLVNFKHTLHCQHALLMDANKNRDVRTPAIVMYPHCLEVGMAEGMYPGPLNK